MRGGLPGERLVVDVVEQRRDYARAVPVEVLTPSPERIEPPCAARRAGCGGCDWQHVSAAGQRRWKTEIVVDALRRTARLPDARVEWGGSVAPWGYRTSMRLAPASDGSLGLRAASSNRVVVIDECPVADPMLDDLRRSTRATGRDEVSLRVGRSSGDRSVWSPGDAATVVRERVDGVELEVSSPSFFQSGPDAAALLVDTVRRAVGPPIGQGRLLDAYGGVGLFAATLGWPHCIVVESATSSCADARRNLPPHARVVESRLEDWPAESVDAVVADPARTGLGREGVAIIAATGAERVVLVSCDPVAMARDTALLAGVGLVHERSVVLDLFPQTHHVEVVTTYLPSRAMQRSTRSRNAAASDGEALSTP